MLFLLIFITQRKEKKKPQEFSGQGYDKFKSFTWSLIDLRTNADLLIRDRVCSV